jgi:hypothetical protein
MFGAKLQEQQLNWTHLADWPNAVTVVRSLGFYSRYSVRKVGTLNTSATSLISERRQMICDKSNDERECKFLFQRLSVTLQRFDSVLLLESFVLHDQKPRQLWFLIRASALKVVFLFADLF